MTIRKYLNIKTVGHDFVVAFENSKKTEEKQPDFTGDGVAVWVREFDDEKKKAEENKPRGVL